MVVVDDLAGRFGRVPAGPWSEPPRSAVVVPVRSNKPHQLAGLLVVGISPRLRLDDLYRGFLDLMASQIATTIANARAYEEERRRAETLAEIDRAKTTFFSNVSHEFRTPLTLMLGPLEDALALPAEALPERREDLALVHRNGLRLLRLVNTLLDFSRIEAGRVQACYEPVDLAAFTAELASVFRAATDKAGLRLSVDCPTLAEPVWVDRDMWEKIVLNLVSNAFKFTLEGGIAVRLRQAGGSAVLAVADTGTGVAAHELPRLFDRFHRVEGARGRTHEGTGIGLALVQELAKLHGGAVRAESVPGEGSTFTVTIPLGTAHLPPDRLRAERTLPSTALGAQPFVDEALRWLPGADDGGNAEPGIERALLSEPAQPLAAGRAGILVADDNADMREYLRRLLGTRYDVRVAADGDEALAALREKLPDLLLSDIMMPRMDGYALLRQVRADPALADVPVIFLSARAGEEASVEGRGAGADDYLVKPFSARELAARVAANLEMARIRRDAQRSLRQAYRETTHILESIDDAFYALDRDLRFRYVNLRAAALWNQRPEEMIGQPFLTLFPQAAPSEGWSRHLSVMQTGTPARFETISATIIGRWIAVSIYPTAEGGLSVFFQDISERKRGEQREIAQRQILEMVATGKPLNEILDRLMLFIEAQEPGMIAGLLLTDDGIHFRPGSGPSIPAGYKQALHEAIKTIPVTPPYFATCAEATHCRTVILCPDVSTEGRYAEAWRGLMLGSGLHAVRSTPVRASDGRILGCLALYFGNARDPNPADPELVEMATNLAAIAIERDQAEGALRKTQAQLQAIFDDSPLGVYLVDADLRIRMLNPTARLTFGDMPDLIGRDFGDVLRILWPEPYPDEIVRVFRRTIETGEPYHAAERIERRLDRGVVEYYEWHVHRVPLPEGRYGAVCYFRDIAAQVLARRAIAASEDQLAAELAATRRLQETSAVLVREGESDALYRHILDAAIELMRSDMGSMQTLDRERGDLRLLAWSGFDDEAAAAWQWVYPDTSTSCGAALVSGRRIVVPDIEACGFLAETGIAAFRRAGIRAMQSTPLVSRAGHVLGMISTHWCEPHQPTERDLRLLDVLARQAADLMERSAAEAALRDINASLEERMRQRTRDLENEMAERQKVEAALQQAQRLEAVGQLTGGVAHDFNNLLTVVIGQTESIAAAADANQRIKRMAAAAQRAAERGAQLTNQLLSFSGRQQLRPVTLAIDGLMRSVGDLVRRAIGETITVQISVASGLWPAHLDPARFESAILNLAINARDAMPDGGRLAIAARNATVGDSEARRLDLQPGEYVVASVSDTGIGMTPEVRRRAFEPFYTTKDIGKGTGLGLSQIYGFVRQSGGTAIIESASGEGTTVALYLPRADAPAVEEPAAAPQQTPRLGTGKTVLVVEDQADVRDMIEVSLRDMGYRVLTASDGVAGRRLLESKETIDLLLTDVVMPNGVSGLDLAEDARRLRQDLRIVLVSGYLRDADSRRTAIPGFLLLEKPFKQEQLSKTVAAALGRS